MPVLWKTSNQTGKGEGSWGGGHPCSPLLR